MATGRCQGCGGELPGGAAFCPRCGLGIDQIPILGLLGDDPADPRATDAVADGGARTRATRTLVGVVLGVVILLVVLAALGSDSDDGTDGDVREAREESERSSTTRRPASSRPPTTVLAGRPPLIDPSDANPLADGLVLLHVTDGVLVVADLATGVEIEVPGPTGTQAQLALSSGHLVSSSGDVGIEVLDLSESGPLGPESWERREIDGASGSGLWNGFLTLDDQRLAGFGASGEVIVWNLPVAMGSFGLGPVGVIGRDLVLSSADGVYLIGLDGDARRVARGQALATNGSEVLVQSCDDALRCGLELVDPTTHAAVALPPLPEEWNLETASLSPDGAGVAVSGWTNEVNGPTVLFLSGEGWVSSISSSSWMLHEAAWDPSRAVAGWWSLDTGQVEIIGPGTGTSMFTDVDAGMPGSGLVVARDDLPEAWRTQLAG